MRGGDRNLGALVRATAGNRGGGGSAQQRS